jgi:cell division protein FtsQ
MNSRWKKVLKNAGWLTLTAGGIALLVAAVQKKDLKKCADVKVELSGVANHVFMEEKEVLRVLNGNGSLIGQPVETINLQVLERRLEKDKWIKNAELFFDNNNVLQVKVEERIPIARIFTIAGNSFYIDSTSKQLPLSDISIRVPMFTNYPSVGSKMSWRDSALMASIKEVATFVNADEFWSAQVSQVDITPQRTFEMIPTVGNHTVKLGKGTDIKEKLGNLYTFYKQVWTKVGLEKYAIIDVQFKGQVIATRKGAWTMNVDSAKVKEAFATMLESSKPDTIEIAPSQKQVVLKTKRSESKPVTKQVQPAITKPMEVKQQTDSKPKEVKQPTTEAKPEDKKVPKAVMQKKEE